MRYEIITLQEYEARFGTIDSSLASIRNDAPFMRREAAADAKKAEEWSDIERRFVRHMRMLWWARLVLSPFVRVWRLFYTPWRRLMTSE